MKSVTIREAQHNLAGILHEVEAGEVVEILRRKVPVARIVPISGSPHASDAVDWEDHEDQMAAVWGSASILHVQETLDDLRGGR
ncbi:hypothetical protein BH20VER1_BH20VER1_19370 [soil metagenome]